MQNLLKISKYEFGVVILYIVLFPLLFIFSPYPLNYGFDGNNIAKVLFVIIGTLIFFYLLNRLFILRKIKKKKIEFKLIIVILIYSLFFSIPEEIIFRGIIQNIIYNLVSNSIFIVLISSVIFGLAHLPNGAQGLKVKDWNWQFATLAFIAGIPLGSIFVITGSLLIPTLFHVFFILFLQGFTEKVQHI
jgi:membrane protease YdiL (CAAX protease family)